MPPADRLAAHLGVSVLLSSTLLLTSCTATYLRHRLEGETWCAPIGARCYCDEDLALQLSAVWLAATAWLSCRRPWVPRVRDVAAALALAAVAALLLAAYVLCMREWPEWLPWRPCGRRLWKGPWWRCWADVTA
ncbi:hypothetical protein FN846DRAFT_892341 [Sphaerosporella brunnea]|uniref:MARVEL domain-containing protein n=1 Tax=Sphaerosporella brunnea TaxID=1250544 RepID=A0A5J5EPH0_9PEZI|nr:hypothetical protein FN846DRAFT_892341 [Sphaerosporella brunnea]